MKNAVLRDMVCFACLRLQLSWVIATMTEIRPLAPSPLLRIRNVQFMFVQNAVKHSVDASKRTGANRAMQQLAYAIVVEEDHWASKILHEQKIEIRTWTLPKYEGATIGITVAGTNAICGQVKLVRFQEIGIHAFKSLEWQAKHHIFPGDKFWHKTIKAFQNGKRVYGWHFGEPLAYKEPVGFTNKHGRVCRHPLENDALYNANVRNQQLGLPMQPGKMMKRSQCRVGVLNGDDLMNNSANGVCATESAEDDPAVRAKATSKPKATCKTNGKGKVKVKGKAYDLAKDKANAKVKSRVSTHRVIEELEGQGLNKKYVMKQALACHGALSRCRSRANSNSFTELKRKL